MVRCDKTIAITTDTKTRLDELKIVQDETYNSMINRLIDEIKDSRKISA